MDSDSDQSSSSKNSDKPKSQGPDKQNSSDSPVKRKIPDKKKKKKRNLEDNDKNPVNGNSDNGKSPDNEGLISVKEEFCSDMSGPFPIPTLTKRRRTVLSLPEKVELLRKLHMGVSQKDLAKQYGIGTSTVSDMKKHEAEILGYVSAIGEEAGAVSTRGSGRSDLKSDVEDSIISWLGQESCNGESKARRDSCTNSFKYKHRWYGGGGSKNGMASDSCYETLEYDNSDLINDEDCHSQVCPESLQPTVNVEENHVSVQQPPVQDVPSSAEAATLLSRALVWAAAQQDTTPQQLFVIKQLQTRAAMRGMIKDGL